MKRAVCISVAASLLLAGCGSSGFYDAQASRPSVVAIVKAMDSLHWLSVEEGLEQAAEDYGVDLNLLWPEKEDDTETQNRIIQDAIRAEPDALILAPCDSARTAEYAAQLKGKKTRLFYMDEAGSANPEFPYIGSDNYHAGELAAQKLAEVLPESAKVAVITGSRSQTAHQDRADGFLDQIREHTTLQPVGAKEVSGTTLSGGRTAMKELLAEEPEISGVFCASAMLVMGALEQVETSGREDVLLIGMDTQSDALSALEDGKILAMISQNGYEIGYTALQQAVFSLEGRDVPEKTYVENEIITKEKADDYLQQYAAEGRS